MLVACVAASARRRGPLWAPAGAARTSPGAGDRDGEGGQRPWAWRPASRLGMLEAEQARRLKDAGLDYYNHEPRYLARVLRRDHRHPHLPGPPGHYRPCARGWHQRMLRGGIVGMGESREARAGLIAQLANLDPYPESVPINNLVAVKGTPLADTTPGRSTRSSLSAPSRWRASPCRAPWCALSAGRETMDDALQALCFMAGANSIFYGDRLLTTANPQADRDRALLSRLDIRTEGYAG
ncbi:biotin synthase BioB [Cupriavidus basilensis]